VLSILFSGGDQEEEGGEEEEEEVEERGSQKCKCSPIRGWNAYSIYGENHRAHGAGVSKYGT
jgi:hypothetical protein